MGYKTIVKLLIKIGVEDMAAEVFSMFLIVIFWGFIFIRVGQGFHYANTPSECKVESYVDIILSPFYAFGCNLNKKRFNKSLIIE